MIASFKFTVVASRSKKVGAAGRKKELTQRPQRRSVRDEAREEG
jgi:hypothetical protein